VNYQRETESLEERRRRQRRARLTLLGAVVLAAAVVVPLGVHVRHSWDTSTPVDGSTGLPGAASSSPVSEEEVAVDPEQPWLRPLAEAATAYAGTLDAGGETLQLTSSDPNACPEDTGAMAAALGVPLDYTGGRLSDYPDLCEWSSGRPVGPNGDYVSVSIGFLADWTAADLEDLGGDEDCWRTPVEALAPFAVLEACLLRDAGGTYWTLFAPDAAGRGVWTLHAAVGDNQPISGPTALAAVADVARATW
jgi:hypothetical protein